MESKVSIKNHTTVKKGATPSLSGEVMLFTLYGRDGFVSIRHMLHNFQKALGICRSTISGSAWNSADSSRFARPVSSPQVLWQSPPPFACPGANTQHLVVCFLLTHTVSMKRGSFHGWIAYLILRIIVPQFC